MKGACFQSGNSSTVAVGVECLCLCAMYIACSSAEERRPALCSGRARETLVHAVGVRVGHCRE
jgi:hypothetical protein